MFWHCDAPQNDIVTVAEAPGDSPPTLAENIANRLLPSTTSCVAVAGDTALPPPSKLLGETSKVVTGTQTMPSTVPDILACAKTGVGPLTDIWNVARVGGGVVVTGLIAGNWPASVAFTDPVVALRSVKVVVIGDCRDGFPAPSAAVRPSRRWTGIPPEL
jgi:hypothetical protein